MFCGGAGLILHDGHTRGQAQRHMLVAISCFTLAIVASTPFTTGSWAASAVLVVLCFIAFYLRRFGPRYVLFPVFTVVIFLMGTVLPSPSIWHNLEAALVGGLCSFVIYFYLFRDQAVTAVRHYSMLVLSRYVSSMKALSLSLEEGMATGAVPHSLPLHHMEERVRKQLAQLDSLSLTDAEQQLAQRSELYAMYKLIAVVADSIEQLVRQSPDEVLLMDEIVTALHLLTHGFHALYRCFCEVDTEVVNDEMQQHSNSNGLSLPWTCRCSRWW